MDSQYIAIDVNNIPPIKARVWREIMKFEDERKDLHTVDAVEKYCEVIAKVFGISTDDVLDNLELADVIPLYYKILNRVIAMLTEKLPANKKNTAEAEEN